MQARIFANDELQTTTSLADVKAALAANQLVWIDLERQSPELDAFLTGDLHLHPLTIEDIWTDRGRPKIEDFNRYLYVIVHGIGATKGDRLALQELDVVIGPTWIVTHDPAGLVADQVGDELAHSPRLLGKGVAWLAHGLLDRLVDRYMPVVDELDSEIENLENDVLERAGTPRGHGVLSRILTFKRRLQALRRTGAYQREILLRLSRGEFDEIPPDALPFFRDVYDHFLRISDIAEGYRDLVSSALDAYLSVQSNRMNEIMKTLTLMSTVMLPLTFIAGVYGMNFEHMPELHWLYGYPAAIGLMLAVTIGILLWFRRKGWIARRDED
ncbi:MAG TPA: magnesium/cobalt transporter CorA [Kofleriaceae bacterium]|jgi:magnesium transporter